MNWFRVYHDIIDDPKIIRFAPAQCWDYIRLLCVASRQPKRGTLPEMDAIRLHMRMQPAKLRTLIATFIEHGLIDQDPETKELRIHGWEERQKKSDDSGARKSQWRRGHDDDGRNGTVTGQTRDASRDKSAPRVRAIELETEIESLQAGFTRTPAREAPPVSEPEPEWKPQPLPDESMTGRSGQDQADFTRAVEVLDAHQTTRRLGAELRMASDTPGVRMLRGWQLVVGAMTCQRPDKGKTWGALMGFSRNATQTQFDQCNAQAPARASPAASPPTKTEQELRAQTEEGNRKAAEYRARMRANA